MVGAGREGGRVRSRNYITSHHKLGGLEQQRAGTGYMEIDTCMDVYLDSQVMSHSTAYAYTQFRIYIGLFHHCLHVCGF